MFSQAAPFESKPWQERLSHIMETMRELSTQTDPQEMVQQYYERMRQVNPHVDRRLAGVPIMPGAIRNELSE